MPAVPHRERSRLAQRLGAFGAVIFLGCATFLLAGPLPSFATVSVALFGVLRWRSHRRGTTRSATASLTEVPAVVDLLAACLSSGASLGSALSAVADSLDDDIGALLTRVAGLTLWGASVEIAWADCLEQPEWAAVARAVIRASYSGAALADVLTLQAAEARRSLRAAVAVRAQRAGVTAVLPLGLCFLPAFVLAGIVPVVVGFAGALRH
jgi:pilus assembly protein TadC